MIMLEGRIMSGRSLGIEVVEPSKIVSRGVQTLVNTIRAVSYPADCRHPMLPLLHLAKYPIMVYYIGLKTVNSMYCIARCQPLFACKCLRRRLQGAPFSSI